MKTATVADLRNRFPSVFRWIEEGETVELTKRGKIVARKFKIPDVAALQRKILGEDAPVYPSIGQEERDGYAS